MSNNVSVALFEGTVYELKKHNEDNQDSDRKYPLLVIVRSRSSGKLFAMVNKYDLDLRMGDHISCVCKLKPYEEQITEFEKQIREKRGIAKETPDTLLKPIEYPLVYIDLSTDAIKGYLSSKYTDTYNNVYDSKVIRQLSALSCKYRRKHLSVESVMELASNFLVNPRIFVIEGWSYQFDDRQLKLWGFTPDDIRDIDESPLLINKALMCLQIRDVNRGCPNKIPYFSMSRCKQLINLFGRELDPVQEQYGLLLRYLYSMLKSGYTSVHKDVLDRYVLVDINVLLTGGYGVCISHERLYLTKVYEIELLIKDHLVRLLKSHNYHELDYDIDVTNNPGQEKAIHGAMSSKISLITGEAGTGKTRVINQLHDFIKMAGLRVCILAPTGAAVERIRTTRSTSAVIMTIDMYRVLGNYTYDWIIVDESSMVCYDKAFSLLSTTMNRTNLTFVGDPNQLQPVSFGEFFTQLVKLDSIIPNYRLTDNFRSTDGILMTAQSIISRRFKGFITNDDLFVSNGGLRDVELTLQEILKAGIHPDHVTLIAPTNNDVDKINAMFWVMFKHKLKSVPDINESFEIGKRVMVLKNIGEGGKRLMNGQEGKVVGVFKGYITIDFKRDRPVRFRKGYAKTGFCTDNLRTSFCKTVHKMQGSEANICICYFPSNSTLEAIMYDRSLLYTAITRAKLRMYMIGNLNVMCKMAVKDAEDKGSQLSKMVNN